MSGRREDDINRESKGLLKHIGYDSPKQFAADFKTGVSIDLNKPNFELLVNHKVQPKHLEVMLQIVGIKLKVGGSDCISGNGLHLRVDMLSKADFVLLVFLVKIFLELTVGKFVAFLMFAVES